MTISREYIHYMAGLLFFFLLPFNLHFFPYFIGLFLITWFIQRGLAAKLLSLIKNKRAMGLMIFYLLFALSMIYSENVSKSLTDLEKKLSFLVMPLLFATANKYLKKNYHYLLLAFLLGTTLNVFISSGNFLMEIFLNSGSYEAFLKTPFWYAYRHLAIFNHSSYFALFIGLSIGILIYFFNTKPFKFSEKKRTKLFICLWIILLSVICIMNSSRGGIMALFVFFIFSFFSLIKNIYLKFVTILIITGLSIYGLSTERFENYTEVATELLAGNKFTQQELLQKDADRLVLWQNSIKVIQSNFWLGTGNGDIKMELKKRYKKNRVYEDLKKVLNPHNQFLSIFVGLGVIGFGYFLFLLANPFIKGLKEKNYLLLAFLVLIVVHFFVESMLNRLSGIAFFSAFYSLL